MELDDVVFSKFVRKPFFVDAIEVTEENIEELAPLVGTFKRKPEDQTPYIAVDKRLVPNVYRVYVGGFITRMGDNLRCYNKKVFRDQFTESTPDIENWVEFLKGDSGPSDA